MDSLIGWNISALPTCLYSLVINWEWRKLVKCKIERYAYLNSINSYHHTLMSKCVPARKNANMLAGLSAADCRCVCRSAAFCVCSCCSYVWRCVCVSVQVLQVCVMGILSSEPLKASLGCRQASMRLKCLNRGRTCFFLLSFSSSELKQTSAENPKEKWKAHTKQ